MIMKDEEEILDDTMPRWVSDYIAFHNEIRSRFPGAQLFTDPEAPKILMRICLGLCGGLNDRLGQLPFDLYLANQTRRILFIYWVKPWQLEYFLQPNGLNWTVPLGVKGFKPSLSKFRRANFDHVKTIPLFPFSGPGEEGEAGEENLDDAIHRVLQGKESHHRVLALRTVGHLIEDDLEARLKSLGETDMIHQTKTFGRIFSTFFKPSPGVVAELDAARVQMGLKHGESYTAVHCRVRHPRGRKKGANVGINPDYKADKVGLPFVGEDKDYAISVATTALQCATHLSKNANEPIYFFSDSSDLVRYMTTGLTSQLLTQSDIATKNSIANINVVARNMTLENVHIDKQKGKHVHEYYGSFVDLILAAEARCLTYGVGNYAVFAAKISGTDCVQRHRREMWGYTVEQKNTSEVVRTREKMCTL